MQYLPDYDVLRTVFHYKGVLINNGTALSATINTLSPFGPNVVAPTADPLTGFYAWTIPPEISRLLEGGRALVSVTNLWTGVFNSSYANWDHEQATLYCNLTQQYGLDTRSFAKPLKLWSGTAKLVSGSHFYYDTSDQDLSNLINKHTVQTVAPLPSVLGFQLTSSEAAPASGTRVPRLIHDILTNTTQTGTTASSVVLNAGASAIDNFYTGMYLEMDSGPAAGQIRLITSYVGATRTATVELPFVPAPTALGGDTFTVSGPVSLQIELAFIVPRVAKHAGVTAFV